MRKKKYQTGWMNYWKVTILTDFKNEVCEICGKKIPEGTGDEFLDRNDGYRFWLCDECISDGDYY